MIEIFYISYYVALILNVFLFVIEEHKRDFNVLIIAIIPGLNIFFFIMVAIDYIAEKFSIYKAKKRVKEKWYYERF